MEFRFNNSLSRATLTAAFMISLGLSQSALAESGSGEMTVTAGLSQALKVECDTNLSFGTTSLIAGTRTGGDTVITVATDGGTTADDSDGVAAGTGAAGECTVSGSQENTGTFDVSVSAPTMTAVNSGTASITVDNFQFAGVEISGGGATITIGGDLTIPDNLVTDDYDDYSGTATVTVTDPGT